MLCLVSAPHQHDMPRFVFSDSLRLIISEILHVYLLDMFKVSMCSDSFVPRESDVGKELLPFGLPAMPAARTPQDVSIAPEWFVHT